MICMKISIPVVSLVKGMNNKLLCIHAILTAIKTRLIYANVDRSQKYTEWKKNFWGCPGGTVVKSPPANAGDTGSSPGLGRSHMPQSNWAGAWQLLSLRSRARAPQQEKPLHWEAHTPQQRAAPARRQLEKARVQQQRPNAAKNE